MKTAEEWKNEGLCFLDNGKFESAIACFDKSIKLNPNDEFVWNDKGFSLKELQRHEEAIICYDKAIELNPKNEFPWNNKGYSLNCLQSYEEAMLCLDKSIELNPTFSFAWKNKGICFAKQNDYVEASECFKKAKKDISYIVSLSELNDDEKDKIIAVYIPSAYFYVRKKADMLIAETPAYYRKEDYFRFPLVEWNTYGILCGAYQINEIKGIIQENPIEIENEECIMQLMRTFHFEITTCNKMINSLGNEILCYSFEHKVDKRNFDLYFIINENVTTEFLQRELHFLYSNKKSHKLFFRNLIRRRIKKMYRSTLIVIDRYEKHNQDWSTILFNSIIPYHPFLFATAVSIFIVTGKDYKNALANYCFLEYLPNETLTDLITLKEFPIDVLEKIRQVELKLLDELMQIGIESFISKINFADTLNLDEVSILDIYWHIWISTCAEEVVVGKILNHSHDNKTSIPKYMIDYSLGINDIIHNSREYFQFMLSQLESKLNDALLKKDKVILSELLKHRQTINYFIKKCQDLYFQLPHEIEAYLVSHLVSHNFTRDLQLMYIENKKKEGISEEEIIKEIGEIEKEKEFVAFMPLPQKYRSQIFEYYEKHKV